MVSANAIGSRGDFAMAVLVIRHRIQHYDTWRAVFDEDSGARQALGSRRERIYRGDGGEDEVLIYLEWDDIDRAHLFVRSDDLRDSMVRAGVAERPDIWILNEVDRPVF
jgi:hypothetical protein